jgi:hypothetical protein
MLETCLEQAHAPLPLPAGHARMPPGLQRELLTEYPERGFHAPPSGFHRRHGQFALLDHEDKSKEEERRRLWRKRAFAERRDGSAERRSAPKPMLFRLP